MLQSQKFWNTIIRIANNPINRPQKESDRVGMDFLLNITRDAFTHKKPVVWTNLLFPGELLHGLGTISFFPEFASSVAAMTGLSERFLQASDAAGFSQDLCSFHRAIIGASLEGFLPEPDFLVTSSDPCDSAPLSFSFLADHYGVPYHCIDIPSQIDSEMDLEPISTQLREFASAVRATTGASEQEAEEEIKKAIVLSNEAREHALEVQAILENNPPLDNGWDAPGGMAMLVATPGTGAGIDFYRSLTSDLRREIEKTGRRPEDSEHIKLLWLHLKPYFPNGLNDFIKESRVAVVCEEYSQWQGPRLDPENPFLSLAIKMTDHPLRGPSVRRMDAIKEMALNHNVDGVVHFNHRGCRQSCGCAQQVKDELASIGFKTLVLDGECIDESEHREGQMRTRLEAFFETLN